MSTKNINDLRESLFDTMQRLKDGSITIEQAKVMADIGQTIINTAKVEVDYIKAGGGKDNSQFIEDASKSNTNNALPPGITGITVHKMGD